MDHMLLHVAPGHLLSKVYSTSILPNNYLVKLGRQKKATDHLRLLSFVRYQLHELKK